MYMKPTPGRLVYYFPGVYDGNSLRPPHVKEPLAAIITYVTNDRKVNLAVFNTTGGMVSRLDCTLLQGENEAAPPNMGWAEWMPYQKGQAAKTEATEDLLKAATGGTKVPKA